MVRTRVLVVDDNIQFRWSLMKALGGQDLEIVEEASNGHEGVQKALAVRPDVVLADLNMPEADGITLTRLLQERAPEIKVLVFTVSDTDENLVAALNSGARGYLLKTENLDMIAEAINYVTRGGIVISPSMANKLRVDFGGPNPPVDDSKGTDAPEAVVGEPKSAPPAEIPVAAEEAESSGEAAIDSEEPPKAVVGPSEIRPLNKHELVFTASVEPALILRLLGALSRETGCKVVKVDASLRGDTAVHLTSGEPIQLRETLAEMPLVANVTEEPFPAESHQPNRLRVALKNK